MRIPLAVALVVLATSPVAAADGPRRLAEGGLITCWYNEAGDYTGADSAEAGAQPGKPVHTGSGGDYAWSYTIEAPDGRSCPRKVPQ